jgi:hypothetical protein
MARFPKLTRRKSSSIWSRLHKTNQLAGTRFYACASDFSNGDFGTTFGEAPTMNGNYPLREIQFAFKLQF